MLPSSTEFSISGGIFYFEYLCNLSSIKKKTASVTVSETRTFRLHRNCRIASGDSDVFRAAPAVCIINTVRCLALYFETALRCFKGLRNVPPFFRRSCHSRYRIYPAPSFLLPEWYFTAVFPHCAYIRLHYIQFCHDFSSCFLTCITESLLRHPAVKLFSDTLFNVSWFSLLFTCMTSNGILPILRIPNRQNLQPELYRTELSVQKIPACEQLLVFRFRSSICFFFGFIRAN